MRDPQLKNPDFVPQASDRHFFSSLRAVAGNTCPRVYKFLQDKDWDARRKDRRQQAKTWHKFQSPFSRWVDQLESGSTSGPLLCCSINIHACWPWFELCAPMLYMNRRASLEVERPHFWITSWRKIMARRLQSLKTVWFPNKIFYFAASIENFQYLVLGFFNFNVCWTKHRFGLAEFGEVGVDDALIKARNANVSFVSFLKKDKLL